jgi:hypothetical protein
LTLSEKLNVLHYQGFSVAPVRDSLSPHRDTVTPLGPSVDLVVDMVTTTSASGSLGSERLTFGYPVTRLESLGTLNQMTK